MALPLVPEVSEDRRDEESDTGEVASEVALVVLFPLALDLSWVWGYESETVGARERNCEKGVLDMATDCARNNKDEDDEGVKR